MEDAHYREQVKETAYLEFKTHHTWENRAEQLLEWTK